MRQILLRRGHPFDLTPKIIASFWAKVEKPSLLDCWIWQGTRNDYDYGTFTIPSVGIFYAHRLAYVFHYGMIAQSLKVCHYCDCPPCCNPWHLTALTQRENIAQSVARHRHSSMCQRQRVDARTKQLVVVAFAAGESRRDIATRLGVSARIVYKLGSTLTANT